MKENNLKTKVLLVRAVTVLLLAVSGTTAAWADEVTAEEALQQAQAFFSNHQSAATGVRRAPGITPQLTAAGQVSGLYVFNVADGGGFVIVSNDDATIPILGYSDNGSIDPNHMPDNLRAWLQGYADQIAWLNAQEKQGEQKVRRTQRKVQQGTHSTDPIGPLLTTTWGQDSPYNLYCPTGCPTGCVATAMAQVMYYTEIKASNTTTTTTATIPGYSKGGHDLQAILVGTTLYWSSMKDNYSSTETGTAAQAVATLMQCCGYSVEADYGPGGTQAQTHKVANALKSYFGYNESTKYVSRSFYSYDNWIDMIYNELREGRPVLYSGSSVDNGHAFICDGYKFEEETDRFHINWGWGGLSDGYFALSALDPYAQGTGGSVSGSGYHFCQEAIVGIKKGNEGTVLDNANTVDLTLNSISVDRDNVGLGETVNVTVNVTNNSGTPYDGEIIIAVNEKMSYGANVIIPANTTQDCVIQYTPRFIGTATIKPRTANGTGEYIIYDSSISDELTVIDATPTNLTVSNVTWDSADIGWTPRDIGEKWNLRYRPLTITKVDFNDGELPTGWQNVDNDNDGYNWEPRDLGDNNYCMSSASYLNEVGALTPSNWLITPQITLGGSFSFWAWGHDDINFKENFIVMYSTNGSNFTSLTNYIETTHTPTLYTIDLTEYSGTGYIAIIHTNCTNQFCLNIDDVTIEEPAGDWATVSNINTNNYTLTGLDAAMNYEVQVQTAFEAAVSGWSDIQLFSMQDITPADLAAVPTSQSALVSWTGKTESYKVKYRTSAIETSTFSDGFEEWNTKGWTIYTEGEKPFTYGWFIPGGFGTPHSGNSMISAWSNNGGTTYNSDNWLITPQVTLGDNLKFWELTNSGYPDSYEVLLSTTGTATTDFTTTLRALTDATGTWSEVNIDLSTYKGQQGYIAIHHVCNSGNYLLIDDFSINTVTPAGAWMTINPDPDKSPVNITGLQANTTYDYQVIGVENNTEVASSDILTFTTTNNAAFELADDDRTATTKNADLIAAWNGITATVTLSGRTLYKDGKWNTICLPFNVTITGSALDGTGVVAYTVDEANIIANEDNGAIDMLNIHFVSANGTLVAGKPYIIKWAKAEGYDEADPDTRDITNPEFTNVTIDKTVRDYDNGITPRVRFRGTNTCRTFTTADKGSYLLMGGDNKLYYAGNGAGMGAFRAFFDIREGSAGIKAFNLNIDGSDTTEITDTDCTDQTDTDNGWWTLSGIRLNGKPTEKGVYLFNGKKVVVQ